MTCRFIVFYEKSCHCVSIDVIVRIPVLIDFQGFENEFSVPENLELKKLTIHVLKSRDHDRESCHDKMYMSHLDAS